MCPTFVHYPYYYMLVMSVPDHLTSTEDLPFHFVHHVAVIELIFNYLAKLAPPGGQTKL